MFSAHTLIARGSIRMRHCYYCGQPIATAFYLPAIPGATSGWACAAHYVEHVVVPATAKQEAAGQTNPGSVARSQTPTTRQPSSARHLRAELLSHVA